MPTKLSLSKKLLLSNILYGLPLVVLMTLMINAKTKDISFAQAEMMGSEYQRPVEQLFHALTDHKLTAQRALHGDADSRSRLPAVQENIERALQSVQEADQKLGTSLHFSLEELRANGQEHLHLSKIREKWNRLKSALSGLKPADSNNLHDDLTADIRALIAHLGNTSNLILDPDLDSYYLVDLTLNRLPQIQDRIEKITAFTEPILRRRQITPEERRQLNTDAILLKTVDLPPAVSCTQTALQEDRNFYEISPSLQSQLPRGLRELTASVERLQEMIDALARSESPAVDIDTFLKTTTAAREASFSYWTTAATELEGLLQTRINTIRTNRLESVLLGLLSILFAALVSWSIAISLKKSLTEAVTRLTKSASHTGMASQDLVRTSQGLAASSTEQANAIQETTATLDQINAMVKRSLESAQQSAHVAQASHKTAEAGQESIGKMIHAINEIHQSNQAIVSQVAESNQRIEQIVRIIDAIGAKTKVINDIVFQTKLLSFNASVEAARAGENGKGFAVVAEEIGSLAAMSGQAAKEITEMLDSSTKQVSTIIGETKSKIEGLVLQGKSKVDTGNEVAQHCGAALEQIVRTVSDVNRLVHDISQASQEQANGINEITSAMQQLDETTQQNSRMSNETAGHSELLAQQARELRSVVGNLETSVFGHTVPVTPPRPAAPHEGPATELKTAA